MKEMGSSSPSEDEKLAQMIVDFFESSAPSSISWIKSSNSLHQPHPTHLQAILNNVTTVEMGVLEKVSKYLQNVRLERKTSALIKCLVTELRTDGIDASVSTSKTSWITAFNCPGSDYEYINVKVKDDDDGVPLRLIVDIDFKSQFELARPTEEYTNLLNLLPSVFVGKEENLVNIVSIVCSAAELSLKQRGLHVPPWRRARFMISKWISNKEDSTEKRDEQDDDASSKFTKWVASKGLAQQKEFKGWFSSNSGIIV